MLGILLFTATSCIPVSPIELVEDLITEPFGYLPYAKASGERVHLVNNKKATDPTWQQLLTFLETDNSDDYIYRFSSFMCADFAEMLHNNAEKAGIKAAFVVVSFVDDALLHALNAFNTVDKGLVYIDCTGEGFKSTVPYGNGTIKIEYDKVAYIDVGKEYGLISIDKANSPSYLDYEYYKQKSNSYRNKLEAYNNKVLDFNKRVEAYNRYPYDRSTYYKLLSERSILEEEARQLEALRLEVGDYWWETLGVVRELKIYW